METSWHSIVECTRTLSRAVACTSVTEQQRYPMPQERLPDQRWTTQLPEGWIAVSKAADGCPQASPKLAAGMGPLERQTKSCFAQACSRVCREHVVRRTRLRSRRGRWRWAAACRGPLALASRAVVVLLVSGS